MAELSTVYFSSQAFAEDENDLMSQKSNSFL